MQAWIFDSENGLTNHMSESRIEPIIYSVVNLHRDKTYRAFLRTIETSTTKSTSFFSTHVKSLCVAYDVSDHRIGRVIHACQGVTSLTFWTVRAPICYQPSQDITQILGPLRPRKLSIFLTGILNHFQPPFQAPFFQNITHLSVVNSWEDWSTWSGFDHLSSLTHLSFDISVGPKGLCREAARLISGALHEILVKCHHLRVCILIFIFDPAPHLSAANLLSAMSVHPDSTPDPRVVFMHDSEPFLEREINSAKESRIWSRAERAVADFTRRRSRRVLGVFALISFLPLKRCSRRSGVLLFPPFPGDVFSI